MRSIKKQILSDNSKQVKLNLQYIHEQLDLLRDFVGQELNKPQAKFVDIELVRKLGSIEREIRSCL